MAPFVGGCTTARVWFQFTQRRKFVKPNEKDRESGKDANLDFRGICQKADASEIDTERLLYWGTGPLLPQTPPYL